MTDEQIAAFIKEAIDNAVKMLAPRISGLEERIRVLEERPHFERPDGGR